MVSLQFFKVSNDIFHNIFKCDLIGRQNLLTNMLMVGKGF